MTCIIYSLGLTLKVVTTKQLILFTVPTICEPISCQPVSFCHSDFSHMTGIELADSSDSRESMKVDLY